MPAKTTTLFIKCSWCQKDLGEKEGQGVSGTSHGICSACFDKEIAKLEKRKKVITNA
jgi:hypothetical protein